VVLAFTGRSESLVVPDVFEWLRALKLGLRGTIRAGLCLVFGCPIGQTYRAEIRMEPFVGGVPIHGQRHRGG